MDGVMADETLRSIYSAADETIAQLDQLQQSSRERALTTRQSLDAACARLGDASLPFVGEMDAGGLPGGTPVAPRPVKKTCRGSVLRIDIECTFQYKAVRSVGERVCVTHCLGQ